MIQTLADALSERGYDTLTPVQDAVTNPEYADADLLVSAQTGSGKTVGFGLAIAGTLLGGADVMGPVAAPLALIVAPTRELAFQVCRELGWLYAKTGARVTSCVGGMDMRDERRALERGAHIVVGTPGRLVDHIKRGSLDMTGLKAIVLDEADEMLDLGFREDLEFMLGEAPEDRRTLMFSATVPPMIAKLAEQFQRDAVRVTTLSDKGQHADIAYQALQVAQQDVENAVINVLRFHEAENAIVFANTRATVNRLTARFSNRGFSVVSLSGELSQAERSHALQAMRDGRARVCVATDVAARGIDLPGLELVVHAELPSNSETLLHRSGRTGRAGRKGVSALIVPPRSVKKAERLLKFAKVQAEWVEAPSADAILARDEERLLADPAWQDTPSEGDAAFAARLLEAQSAEAIAVAFLRLYRDRHCAPEDLSAPDARPARKEREPFGPSVWYSLSVGQEDRAEARWLLPLILRSGRLEKSAIGAIRVQGGETFVEIAEAAADNFEGALGPGGILEEGVAATRLAEAPVLAPLPPRGKPSGPRGPRRDREDRPEGERRPRREFDGDRPKPRDFDGDRPKKRFDDDRPKKRFDDDRPKKRFDDDRPKKRFDEDRPKKRFDEDRPKKRFDDDRPKRFDDGARPDRKPFAPKGEGKPYGQKRDDRGDAPRKPRAAAEAAPGNPKKVWGKPAGKPARDDRPGGFGKPRGDGERGPRPGGKPFGKPGGKPGGKPAGKSFGKPGGKPAGKPGAKPGGKPKPGGFQTPRRPKS
ncbi:DEAD/DEAH box helicase [Pseudooceanicola onchidii]|uniref:DEAD/DEAH box helicase n=1 Tax=Pseudooceanicola onchidii TaxID=2562279 RepID=UPI0010AAEBD2|nr:DEAD/DEAH box helicase [Pseudooceanicola onchidii]